MFKIFILDRTAASRNRMLERVEGFLRESLAGAELLPQLSLRPITQQELKFHGAPDILLVGEELVADEVAELGAVRRVLPKTPIVVWLEKETGELSMVERLARMGADDVLYGTTDAASFFQRVILLARKAPRTSQSKLITVDSAKGGLGVTSLVAGLSEAMLDQSRKVVAIDFDFQTQDLSRFLQARPYVNENLQQLLNLERPVTQELVEQCLVNVWRDVDHFRCMPPVMERSGIQEGDAARIRAFMQVLEVLDSIVECAIVDVGSLRGTLLRNLYRVSDHIVFVMNNDPATLFASLERLKDVRRLMAPDAELTIVENMPSKWGLSSNFMGKELSHGSEIDERLSIATQIPFCPNAARWPGSGGTMSGLGSRGIRRGFAALVGKILDGEAPRPHDSWRGKFSKIVPIWRQPFIHQKELSALPSRLSSRDTVTMLPSAEASQFPKNQRLLPLITEQATTESESASSSESTSSTEIDESLPTLRSTPEQLLGTISFH